MKVPVLIALISVASAVELKEGLCTEDICGEGGTCVEFETRYMCNCMAGYVNQHGVCILENTVTDKNACSMKPCGEHGTCILESESSHQCLCHEGYEGYTTCEKKWQPCEFNPCGDHGFCAAFSHIYVCQCDSGYEDRGGICVKETPNSCNGNPCGMNGTCYSLNQNNHICSCQPGFDFDGSSCIQHTDACGTDGAVCGAHGTCVPLDTGNYQCLCYEGYEYRAGVCEKTASPCDGNPCGDNGICGVVGMSHICGCGKGYLFDGGWCMAE